MTRRFISICLSIATIAYTMFSPFETPRAQAANVVVSTATKFTGCYVGASLAPWLTNKIGGLEKRLTNLFTGIGGIGLTVPVYDSNSEKFADAFTDKTTRTDIIARCIAREIFDNLSGNISTIIQTRGRDGGASFVTDWNNFQNQAQYRGENVFRAMLSTSKLCPYFGDDLKKVFGLSPNQKISLGSQKTRTDSLTSFASDIGCTMPAGFDPAKFDQDFAGAGGWDAIARLAQPQNNYYGALLLSYNEATKQRNAAQSADVNQAVAGKGYTGISGNGKADSCQVSFAGSCIVYKSIKTTGSYIADNAAATINAEFSWLANTQELGTLISTGIVKLLNHLLDQSNPNDGDNILAGDGDAGTSTLNYPDTGTDTGTNPNNPAAPVCSATAPQAGFLNVLTRTYQQLASYNFSSSAATMGDTGLTGPNPFSDMSDLLSGQKDDSTGTQYSDQINSVLHQIDLLLATYHDITGVFGNPDHIMTTQDRDDLNTARNNVLTLLTEIITAVNATCSTPTPTP